MKLLRYGPAGAEKPGLLDSEGRIRDLSHMVDDIAGDVLSPGELARIAALDGGALPVVDAAGVRIGPCVGRVSKMVCVGLNYADHAAEANLPLPKEPILFLKATSAICGPNDDVLIPRGSTKTDWEVELGVVIGRTARYVSEEDAMEYIAGYAVVNDVSEREYQLERGGGQWDKGKGCDTFGPLGPWLVTRDEIPNPQALRLSLKVDGKTYQDGSTETMVFNVRQLVSYISRFMTLNPGDVIATGTPPGVGMGQKPAPVFLRAGQVMSLGIEGLGEQTQRVVAEAV
jgi:2-keto-4-pentenoate hydratase/2-oxohepta-3-ene-1,7-dioic acid hydratase in catechol pathway